MAESATTLGAAARPQEVVEDDRAESRGGDAAQGKSANPDGEIARPGGEREGGRDEIARVGEIDAILDPDAPGGGGDETEDDQRQAADHRPR